MLRGATGLGVAVMLVTALAAATIHQARADDANQILRRMSDFLAGQQNLSASFDSDIEVITPDVQKIQFASSGRFAISRPDKVRISRTGGYSDVEIVYDGRTATVYGKNLNGYAQANASGSIDDLVARLRDKLGVALPGADLLSPKVYDLLMSDVIRGAHIGRGVINGVECDHLAFRGEDVDWQIWIEVGNRPLPHKYVITSKAVGGAPQYTLVITDWKTNLQPPANAYAFAPPPNARKLDPTALASLDEIPPESTKGEQK